MSRTRRLMPYTWNTTGSVINGSGFLGFLRHGAHLALIKPGAVWAASATPGYRIFNTKSRGIHNGFRAWTDTVAGIWMVCSSTLTRRPGAGQSGTPKHQHPRGGYHPGVTGPVWRPGPLRGVSGGPGYSVVLGLAAQHSSQTQLRPYA